MDWLAYLAGFGSCALLVGAWHWIGRNMLTDHTWTQREILAALGDDTPRTGYAIGQVIEEQTGKAVPFDVLYRALDALRNQGRRARAAPAPSAARQWHWARV